MKKILLISILIILSLQVVFATQQTFTGTVLNAIDGDLILARVEGNNFIEEVLSNRYRITVEGTENSEVQFWMKDHIIHRELLTSGVKPVDLDTSKISTTIDIEKPVDIPVQDKLPITEKKFSLFWIFFLLAFLLIIGGSIFYLQKNNWQLPFNFSKLKITKEKKEIRIPPKRITLTPPKFSLKKEIKIPPKINFEKPQELTPPKSNGAINQLKNYVKSMKDKGFDINQIKAALYARGWKRELIEKALN